MITGFWVGTDQYRMYDERTKTTWLVMVPGADLLDNNEVYDIVEEAKEQFAEQIKEKPTHQAMPIAQQHELAPHLRAIEETNRKVRETGHGRYF